MLPENYNITQSLKCYMEVIRTTLLYNRKWPAGLPESEGMCLQVRPSTSLECVFFLYYLTIHHLHVSLFDFAYAYAYAESYVCMHRHVHIMCPHKEGFQKHRDILINFLT